MILKTDAVTLIFENNFFLNIYDLGLKKQQPRILDVINIIRSSA